MSWEWTQDSVGWAVGQNGFYHCTVWCGGGVINMSAPWPGQDGDDSDQQRASLGVGMDVDQGLDTRSNQKRGK